MKNHSSKRAGKGKTGYRTPSMFRANKPESIKRERGVGLKIGNYYKSK